MAKMRITGVGVVDSSELSNLSLAALVDCHNHLADKRIKKFRDKPTAVKRVRALMEARSATGKAARKASDGTATTGRPRAPFNLVGDGNVKTHRQGTKRAKLVDLLTKGDGGKTLDQIQKAMGWSYRQAYEAVRICHFYLGWGVREDSQGRIKLVKERG